MVPDAKQIGSRATRYLIGASIVMLALILFSELSCAVLGLCTNWFPPAELLGFWEMLAISTVGLVAGLSIRMVRQRDATRMSADEMSSAPPLADISSHHSGHSSVHTSRWRTLFNQLSEEERRKLKTIMEKHCVTDVNKSEAGERGGESPAP